MAGQYSVSKIDTPLSGTVLAFSEQQDFLAISIEFFPSDIIHTILQLENELTERIMSEQLSEQEMTLSDSEVLQSVSRLFSVMNHQTVPSEFIRKNIMQEITYAAPVESSLFKVLQVSDRQRKSIRRTVGSRKIFITLSQ